MPNEQGNRALIIPASAGTADSLRLENTSPQVQELYEWVVQQRQNWLQGRPEGLRPFTVEMSLIALPGQVREQLTAELEGFVQLQEPQTGQELRSRLEQWAQRLQQQSTPAWTLIEPGVLQATQRLEHLANPAALLPSYTNATQSPPQVYRPDIPHVRYETAAPEYQGGAADQETVPVDHQESSGASMPSPDEVQQESQDPLRVAAAWARSLGRTDGRPSDSGTPSRRHSAPAVVPQSRGSLARR